MKKLDYTINVGGRLMSLDSPRVMGILNLTPDSFYSQSRVQTEEQVRQRVRQIADEGGDLIDVGACSTRPGSAPASAAEEMERLREGLTWVRREAPDAVLSVDLRELGQKDILLDPGFGFGKTLDDNYALLSRLQTLRVFELPLLIGVSRKSMIQRVLGVDADHALNGTTVVHTLCLQMQCAQVLRVHDVRAAVEAVKLTQFIKDFKEKKGC